MNQLEINNLKTGDILLLSGKWSWNPMNWIDKIVEFWTGSPYSHCGMILKDPTWINPSMTGLYLWESNYEGTPDPQDDKVKLGVQITPIDIVLKGRHQSIFVRQLFGYKDKLTIPILQKIHKIVYEKPYDLNLIDWLSAYLRKSFEKPKDSRFFCSALLGCIYTEAGLLDKNTNWTLLRPCDFDEINYGKHLNWEGDSHLEGLFEIKLQNSTETS